MSKDIERKLDRVLNELEFIKNRLSIRIGGGTSLTYLLDETPIYVNEDDFGCAADVINGGAYEEENIWVLRSFLEPGTVFIDAGANIGVFTIRLAPRIKTGKVLAFEPHPRLFELLQRNVYLNGCAGVTEARQAGLSDKNSRESLYVPEFSVGGGTITPARPAEAYAEQISCEFHRLDDVVSPDFTCDIVKLDVEGNECAALDGMRKLLQRSASKVKILFEKLGATTDGRHERTYAFMKELGLAIYLVQPPYVLVPADRNQFMATSGYYLAARSDRVEPRRSRGFFSIYPAQLNLVMSHRVDTSGRVVIQGTGPSGALIFHGPYWHLPRGRYDIRFIGATRSPLELTVVERFGYGVTSIPYAAYQQKVSFTNERDLMKFEIVARSASMHVDLELERIEMERL